MTFLLYPKDASFDIRLAPSGPNLIAATADLEEAIRLAKKLNATIEEWEDRKPITAIQY